MFFCGRFFCRYTLARLFFVINCFMLLIFCRYIIFVVEFSPLCFPLWVELHSEPTLSRPKNWLFGRFLGFEPDTLQPGHNIFYDSTFRRDKPQGLAPCLILLFLKNNLNFRTKTKPVLDGADATVNVRFLCQIYSMYTRTLLTNAERITIHLIQSVFMRRFRLFAVQWKCQFCQKCKRAKNW